MPTFRHGRGTRLLFNQFDLSTYFKDASVAQTADTPETTAFQSNNKSYVVGMTDGRVSLGGMFSGDVNGVDQVFNAAFGLEAPLLYTYAPEGLAVGRRVWGMEAHTTSYGVSGSVSDIVATSVELQGTNGVRSGYSLATPDSPFSAAGLGVEVDCGASSNAGGFAVLHVLTNTSVGAAQINVNHATSSGGSFTTVGAFASVGAGSVTAQKVVIAPGTTINQYVKIALVGGTINNILAIHVNLIRF